MPITIKMSQDSAQALYDILSYLSQKDSLTPWLSWLSVRLSRLGFASRSPAPYWISQDSFRGVFQYQVDKFSVGNMHARKRTDGGVTISLLTEELREDILGALQYVGGSPSNSDRKYTDHIIDALGGGCGNQEKFSGSMYFSDNKSKRALDT